MPNTFAYVVLFGWPVLVFVLFRLTTVPKAIAISIVAGYLVLPTRVSFDLPLLPKYDRELAASLPALLMRFSRRARPDPARRRSHPPMRFRAGCRSSGCSSSWSSSSSPALS